MEPDNGWGRGLWRKELKCPDSRQQFWTMSLAVICQDLCFADRISTTNSAHGISLT